jgi:NADH-quinone oxidoreductase subunit J
VTLSAVIFYLVGIVILTATGFAITRRQPIHAVLYLIVAFLGTAALFFLLGAPLLAAFVVIVYAGAIMVLVLFVIMLLQRSPRELGLLSEWGPATLLGVVFLAVAVAMVFKDPGSGIVLKGAVARPFDFGRFLFDRYWLAVEIVSILLLVALVAIIQLGRRRDTEEIGKCPSPHPSLPRLPAPPSVGTGAGRQGGEGEDEGVNHHEGGHP